MYDVAISVAYSSYMELPLFRDYRCTSCARLLLRGCVFQGFVELKCRRCKKLVSWGSIETTPCAVIDVDNDEKVVRVLGEAGAVLGCQKEYVIGKHLSDILAYVSRSTSRRHLDGHYREGYDIPDNHLLLHDGERRTVRTYVVPRRERGIVMGKRVFLAPSSDERP